MSHLANRKERIVIQGGMGVAVSGWQLARAVSLAGQLGVVSGTAIDTVLARRLQMGDPGGHTRRALGEFPYPAMAGRITCGDEVRNIAQFLRTAGATSYSAADVVEYLLSGVRSRTRVPAKSYSLN